MQWRNHSELRSTHAFLGASNWHWINYDNDRLRTVWLNEQAKLRGTMLHAHAENCIKLKTFLRGNSQTLSMYVNDALRFGMKTEQVLVYSGNCYGTADAIQFDEKKHFLRIHDLKTGVVPAHMEQLEIYAALFCLEYGRQYDFRPEDGNIELRIYQNDDIDIYNPKADEIVPIMDKIKTFDKLISKWKEDIL